MREAMRLCAWDDMYLGFINAHTLRTQHTLMDVIYPQLWNTLPQLIKASDNVDLLKKRLKTHLFIEAFG